MGGPVDQYLDVGLSTRVKAGPSDPDNPRTYPDDAYPAVIADQRHGYGCDTVDEVLAYQLGFLAEHYNIAPTLDPEKRAVTPYINTSRWVADCPQCGAANWVWDRNPNMVCLGRHCGYVFNVMWQPPKVRAAAIRVIADWPQGNRSWDAHKGETVEELKIQGVLMQGVEPAQRNGLLVAAGVKMPDELISPTEYLDRLRDQRAKAARALS